MIAIVTFYIDNTTDIKDSYLTLVSRNDNRSIFYLRTKENTIKVNRKLRKRLKQLDRYLFLDFAPKWMRFIVHKIVKSLICLRPSKTLSGH